MSKNENVRFIETTVAYPLVEKAYALINPSLIPFSKAVVGITLPSPNYKISRKSSELCVFEYIIEGEGKLFIDGKWQTAKSGDFYILAAGEEHTYRASSENPWKKIWINYTAAYTSYMLLSYGVKTGIYRAEGARELFNDLINLTRSHAGNEDISFEIADRINAIIKLAAKCSLARMADEHELLRSINGYVHKKLDLETFAANMHMSKSNVIRIFKKQYGKTPYDYLLDLKIETAKALLCQTKLSVKSIADKLAISDEHYFSTLFLKKTGYRPATFRIMAQQNDGSD